MVSVFLNESHKYVRWILINKISKRSQQFSILDRRNFNPLSSCQRKIREHSTALSQAMRITLNITCATWYWFTANFDPYINHMKLAKTAINQAHTWYIYWYVISFSGITQKDILLLHSNRLICLFDFFIDETNCTAPKARNF